MLRAQLTEGDATAETVVADALSRANSNAERNVYLALDPHLVMADAAALPRRFDGTGKLPTLYGVPVSLKDCFDLAGYATSCGSHFYAERNGIARDDSAVAAMLRQQGAIITGKTHLHQLAYGITGENTDYGDCVQPHHPHLLTGGSSSGAAASVQEGSAIAAIGTDTGGSIRVPAALCGLAGYRASHGIALRAAPEIGAVRSIEDAWRGAAHLAPSFDTIGWLFRDLRDGPALGAALFDIALLEERDGNPKIGALGPEFLHDCEPAVLAVFETWKDRLRSSGADVQPMEVNFWADAFEIFTGIQAHEASQLHRGHFAEFQPDIAERLAWGASLSEDAVRQLRRRLAAFRLGMDALLAGYDYLVLPCAPVSALRRGEDHSDARRRILRYTAPVSLGGNPVVALPGSGGGVQLVGHKGADAKLLAYAADLGAQNHVACK